MATTKKKTSTKARKTTKKTAEFRSFKPSPDPMPFFGIKFTHQTVYWTIICALILGLGIWVLALNVKVQNLYNEIDATSSEQMVTGSSHRHKDE